MKRPLCALLVAALVLGTPGLPAWQALAGTARKPAPRRSGSSVTTVRSIGAPRIQRLSLAGSLGSHGLSSAVGVSLVAASPAAAASVGGAPGRSAPAAARAPSPAAVRAPAAPLAASKKPGEPHASRAPSPDADAKPAAKATLEKTGGRVAAGDRAALDEAFEGSARPGDGDVAVPARSWSWRSLLGKAGRAPAKAVAATAKAPSAAETVPVAETPSARPGPLRRFLSIFDLSGFDASQKAYMLGQAVFLLAIAVYLATLPVMAAALTGDAALAGEARAVHYWVFAGASLVAGGIVSRNPTKRVLVGASAARAAIFGSIGALAIFGGLPWAGFLALVGVNAFIVSLNHLVDIDTGGAAKVLGDKDKIIKAALFYKMVSYGMMLAIPPVLGFGMDELSRHVGAAAGSGAGFALFAALMAVVSYIYGRHVKIIGKEIASIPLRGARALLGAGVASLRALGEVTRDTVPRNLEALSIIWSNRAIRTRSVMATLEWFVEDALFAVVLPTFAISVLSAGAFGSGVLLASATGGGILVSMVLLARIQAWEKEFGMYRVMQVLGVMAALAFIPSIGLWAAPSLILAIPVVLLMKVLLEPMRSRMGVLLQTEIDDDPRAKAKADDIYSVLTFFEVLAAGAGALLFAWLFTNAALLAPLGLGAAAPMVAVTVAVGVIGLVSLAAPRMMRESLMRPRRETHASPPGNETRMLMRLRENLAKNALPLEPERTIAGPADDRLPTVAILAPASAHKLAILREGSRQSPGDVHLVLDASWLIHEVHPDGRTTLLVRKGVVMDGKGRARIVTYEQPRRVRYFANYFTAGSNDRTDGVVFEKGLDVPQSSSLQLEAVTNDKLVTRLLMAARQVAVPLTLALALPAHPLRAAPAPSRSSSFTVAPMPEGKDRQAAVARLVDDYLSRLPGDEVVVKPSGPNFHSGYGVRFFRKAQREEIVRHALSLAADERMSGDGAVLFDQRVDSAPLRRDGRKMETTLRVLAARAPWDGFATTAVFARVGPWGKPTTAEAADPRDNATVEPWQALLDEWKRDGLLDEASARRLDQDVQELGVRVFEALAENERSRRPAPGEPRQAQSDLIGLDVMIERRVDADGRVRLVPMVIEVNDHDSGGQYNLDVANRGTELVGRHSREWMATALQRARRDALKGRRIVIGGAGNHGKRFIYERAKRLGVEIVLVDHDTPFVRELIRDGLVAEWIELDRVEPATALARAKRKLLRSARKNGRLDGVTTFWEDDVPLAADLAAELGLPYHTREAASLVRNKALTRDRMEQAGLPVPRRARIPLPLNPTARELDSARRAFELALDQVGLPAVLKPEFGAAAMGVKKIESRAEALASFEEIRAMVRPETDEIFEQGAGLLLEQYIGGREYDVDLVMRDGKALFTSVTDNWPTQEPYFLATGSSLPSRRLSAKEQGEAALLAVRTAQALGLKDGVAHIEGKYTDEGPRIIEANGRMGGEYVHEWVEQVWGVSLVEEGLMAAAGIQGRPFKAPEPRVHLEGEFIIPQRSGVIEELDLPESARRQPGFHELRLKMRKGDRIAVPPKGYDRAGMLVAEGATSHEAQAALKRLHAELLLRVH